MEEIIKKVFNFKMNFYLSHNVLTFRAVCNTASSFLTWIDYNFCCSTNHLWSVLDNILTQQNLTDFPAMFIIFWYFVSLEDVCLDLPDPNEIHVVNCQKQARLTSLTATWKSLQGLKLNKLYTCYLLPFYFPTTARTVQPTIAQYR